MDERRKARGAVRVVQHGDVAALRLSRWGVFCVVHGLTVVGRKADQAMDHCWGLQCY